MGRGPHRPPYIAVFNGGTHHARVARRRQKRPDPSIPLAGSTIGQRINAARLRMGLNKTDLQHLCETTWATINNWVQDTHEPDKDNMRRLAEVLRVDKDWLETGVGEATKRDPRTLEAVEAFETTPDGQSATPEELEELRSIVFGTRPPDSETIRLIWYRWRATPPAEDDR